MAASSWANKPRRRAITVEGAFADMSWLIWPAPKQCSDKA